MVTQARLRELLDYDPDTGVFTWRVGRGAVKAGVVAGCARGDGYLMIMIDQRIYFAHRLAWLYIHGKFPTDQIDHVNRERADNRIGNLRPATSAENHQNKSRPRNNTSGVVGVCWCKRDSKWIARIWLNGRQIYLGLFDTIEEAAAARAAAKAKLHTFHPEDCNEEAA